MPGEDWVPGCSALRVTPNLAVVAAPGRPLRAVPIVSSRPPGPWESAWRAALVATRGPECASDTVLVQTCLPWYARALSDVRRPSLALILPLREASEPSLVFIRHLAETRLPPDPSPPRPRRSAPTLHEDVRPLAAAVRRLRLHARAPRVRQLGLRRGRAALPARGEVDRRGRRRRRSGRVRLARLSRVLPADARAARSAHEGAAERAARGGLSAADRARLCDRRREGGRAVPGGDRGAGGDARLPAGAAGGARPVGGRGGCRGGAVAAVSRLRDGGLPGAHGGRDPRRLRAARLEAPHAAAPPSSASGCSARCPGWARSSRWPAS